MMKRLQLFALLLLGCVMTASADHITGGEIFYTYAGYSNGYYKYNVTVRLFMRCNSGREFNNPTIISVFNRSTGARLNDYSVNLTRIDKLNMVHDDPCINNPPVVCYEVGIYNVVISVPAGAGFTITAHVNFRIDGITNLAANYERIGATYVGDIPGSESGTAENNSAKFVGEDLVVVCAENSFSYSFAAIDPDGDDLRYSFCEAYKTDGGGGGFGNNISPPPPPPYYSVPYGSNFSGNVPLGSQVKIDSKTGLITGIAPQRGIYVVTVCVEEIRNGEVIAVQRKDLQIFIAPCSITAAALPEQFMLCGNTQTLNASNMSTSPLVQSYNWELVDASGSTIYESTSPNLNYTFADTGVYSVKLVINRNQQCSDSAMALARVYPGFEPDFQFSHPCISRPVQFSDRSSSTFGKAVAWEWDFGDGSTSADFSELANSDYTYPDIGKKTVRLIVEDSKGCVDTTLKEIDVYDKPPIQLAFRDTLICPPDDLQLRASGNGVFRWTAAANIRNEQTATPFVNPTRTTTYFVELDDQGCINQDSVKVNVVDKVSLQAMADAIICEGDTVGLGIKSDGLKYSWTPALTIDDASLAQPFARPAETTTYQVTAFISNCFATDEVTITTVPYPTANAGPDTMICFNTAASLYASTDGSSFQWVPALQLSGANTLHPMARPLTTTQYVFYAYDTRGCPKPGTDTVLVTVQAPVNAYAGTDTVVVTGQPLQLKATGGIHYTWSPSLGLSDAFIADPVAVFERSPAEGFHRYKVLVSDEIGCRDSAYLQVQVFASGPEIYVPSAFTPNNDGKNDFFRFIAAGIRRVEVFRLYNRWGQIVYDSPGTHSTGWDGNYAGKPQPSATYVWMLKAVDYTGKPVFKRGTFTLIR